MLLELLQFTWFVTWGFTGIGGMDWLCKSHPHFVMLWLPALFFGWIAVLFAGRFLISFIWRRR